MSFLFKILTLAFFLLVAWLLFNSLSEIEWNEVQRALDRVSWKVLTTAGIGALLNYTILSSYDFLGLRYLGFSFMKYPKVVFSAFISYVFNLNLGGLIGGLGLRFRIYSGWKIPKAKIPLIFLFSVITNWLGYIFLLSLILCFRSNEVEKLIFLSTQMVRVLGGIGLILVCVYILLCHWRFEFNFRSHSFKLPGVGIASLQLLLSCLQWTSLSGVMALIFWGLDLQVEYGDILFTYLIASIAGAIAHIPGGLGVIETIFLRMDLNVPKADILVALICFRAVYYLFPLLLAIPGYFSLEYYQKKIATDIP